MHFQVMPTEGEDLTEFGEYIMKMISNDGQLKSNWSRLKSELEIEIKGNQGLEYELKNDETNDELILY